MNLHERGKARRKQRILDAVVDILDEEGIGSLTIPRIGDKAEVSVKTIYNLMGSLDDILDEMPGTFFWSLAEQLRTNDHVLDTKKFFDEFVDKSYLFLQKDEKRNRAALKAILHFNISSGRSYRNTPSANDQFEFIAKGVRLFGKMGYIRPTVNVELLAEQMLYALAILLELWATKLINLEKFRLSCKYHIWTLIRSWADESFVEYSDETVLGLQSELALLDTGRETPLTLSVI